MTSNKFISIINYIFIFLTINYNVFVKFISGIDSTGYGLIFFSIIVVCINGNRLFHLLSSKPIIFWLFWCLFSFLNYYIHLHINPIGLFGLYRKIFIPLIVMSIVVKEYRENPNKLLLCCFITHVAYMVGGYVFDSGILYRDLDYENELGNAYAIISSFTLFYLILLNRCGNIKFVWFIVFVVIIMTVIAMTGTRKAFGSGIILLVFWGLSIINLKKIYSWLLIGILMILGIKGYNYLIENTYMGERMEILEMQQEEQILPSDAPKFLYKLGDRAPHYYYGWLMFKEKPLTGVGLGQSIVGNVYIHSEFMVQLTDNGIIGFGLFSLLYLWVFLNLLKCYKNEPNITICMLGGLITILFIFITAWGWEYPRYFIALGLIIGYCQCESKKEICS